MIDFQKMSMAFIGFKSNNWLNIPILLFYLLLKQQTNQWKANKVAESLKVLLCAHALHQPSIIMTFLVLHSLWIHHRMSESHQLSTQLFSTTTAIRSKRIILVLSKSKNNLSSIQNLIFISIQVGKESKHFSIPACLTQTIKINTI